MFGPEYHKIQTVWLRDPATNFKTLLEGQWAKPEFGYLAENQWTATEKVDGTNIRIGLQVEGPTPGVTRNFVAGKTDAANVHPDLMERCYEIAAKADSSLAGLTLYGEGFGAGIQKGGGNYGAKKDFVLFDVWAPTDGMWLERLAVEDIARALGLQVVPRVNFSFGTLREAIDVVRDKTFYSAWTGVKPEGLVLRPEVELKNRRGERIITKIKVRDFTGAEA